MAKKTIGRAEILRLLVAALLLVSIFFSLAPHGHSCLENDCALCLLREVYKSVLCTVSLLAVLPVLWALYSGAEAVFTPWGQDTLVQLKVKLSD